MHFSKFYRGNNPTPFNAMLATNSKIDAIRYKEAFDEYKDILTAVVISPPDQREGYEEVDEEPKDRVVKFYNKMIEGYSEVYSYEEHVKDEFIYGEEIDILIVVDKLLTGFDAPRAAVLYIDKPLKEHGLLQAIARVNRIYEGKDYGLIVDYRGLIEPLDSALKTYSGAGLENFDSEDIQGALVDVISVLGKLREADAQLSDIFRNIKNKNDREEFELHLEDDEIRHNFYDALSSFSKYLGIAIESEHVYQALSNEEIKSYKKNLKFYQELRATVKLRYSDTIDHKEYEAKMRNLMDTYIAAEDVMIVTEPVDILNKDQMEEELSKMESSKGKADLIKTRMVRYISKKYDENPAYYKKFSQRIQEIIEEYREKRISAAEQFAKFETLLRNLREGYSNINYPYQIKNNQNAQAFYGVLSESLESISNQYVIMEQGVMEDNLADLSIEITAAVENNIKVDWHDNPEVNKKIESDLLDIFFNFHIKNMPQVDFSIFDDIINNIKSVAQRRY
jgi:type I restriction enzyme R subunit